MATFALRTAAKALWARDIQSTQTPWEKLTPGARELLTEKVRVVIDAYIAASLADRDRDPA